MTTPSKDCGMKSTTWLRCKVNPGQFTGECVVSAADFRDSLFSLFVPEEYVESDSEPTEGRAVDGWVRVEVLDRRGELTLVRLPRLPLENGQTVTVHSKELTFRPARELA